MGNGLEVLRYTGFTNRLDVHRTEPTLNNRSGLEIRCLSQNIPPESAGIVINLKVFLIFLCVVVSDFGSAKRVLVKLISNGSNPTGRSLASLSAVTMLTTQNVLI